MTYTGVLATIFTGIEPSVALSLACVPFLRPLIRGKKTAGSGTDNSQYASSTLRNTGLSETGRSRKFKELQDDSSEIQLRPMGSDSPKYEADISQVEEKLPSESGGAILVKKGWTVVSGSRPES